MMSIKGGTKTWSDSPQVSSLKGDGSQSLSAQEKDAVLGDQDLGTYLNKIADPNYVDPAKMRRVGNSELDKDSFMKLFLAQLKNQDPTNPMESHDLAAQLAQFTSLEKLNSIDDSLVTMSKQSDPTKGYDTLALIGKGISGDSSKILRNDLKAQHDVTFKLGASADEVELSVKNASGQEVKKLVAKNLKEGMNKVSWDGMIDSGTPAPEGQYNVMITAKNSFGQKINAETQFRGRVTGVQYTAEGPVLMVGKQSVKLSDVKSIFEADAQQEQVRSVQAQAVAGKDAKNLASNVVGMNGNLESVGMSQDFINKVEKEAQAVADRAGQEQEGGKKNE
jgi:flagellar basal-body rod modification protein FlgD